MGFAGWRLSNLLVKLGVENGGCEGCVGKA